MRAHRPRALRLPLEALMAHTKDGSGSRLIVATSSVVPLGPTSLVPSQLLRELDVPAWQEVAVMRPRWRAMLKSIKIRTLR